MKEQRRSNPSRSVGRGAWTPWLVLFGSLTLTVVATVSLAMGIGQRDQVRFEQVVYGAMDRIAGRLEVYVALLRGGVAFFGASGDVTEDEFRAYVDHLDLLSRFPGIQGFGWSERIESGLEGSVDERHAIRYLEPLDVRNAAAIGFDMYSEGVRREAMRRARDTGEPAMSGRVTLVQEIIGPQQPGFLIYVPVYATGVPPATVEERRAALRGFVYAPFRAGDLFAGIFGMEATPRVAFSVYDGTAPSPDALLHETGSASGHQPTHSDERQMEIAGRSWTLVFSSQPAFESASVRDFVPFAMVAGLAASLLLYRLAAGQARARAAAEVANRAKSGFLATMSHELRTPLNAISGYVDLLQMNIPGPTTEQQQQYLTRIAHAQRHLLGLINDVLNFAKLDAARVEYRLEPIDVAWLVADSLSLVSVQAAERRIEITSSGAGGVYALGDSEKVRQVLLNLLSNAIKFTEAGGRVAVYWREANGRVQVIVEDSGIGIPTDRQDAIFEPFLQVDADLTRRRQGTGLGLSIARELARGMGGDVTVRSDVGKGSVFTLTLPGVPPPAFSGSQPVAAGGGRAAGGAS